MDSNSKISSVRSHTIFLFYWKSSFSGGFRFWPGFLELSKEDFLFFSTDLKHSGAEPTL
jgi:hypothetical protein